MTDALSVDGVACRNGKRRSRSTRSIAELQRGTLAAPSRRVFCCNCPTPCAVAAPLYRIVIGAAFVLLAGAAIEWARVRPRAVPILRVYAVIGILLALVFQIRASFLLDGSPYYNDAADVSTVEHAAVLVFEAAVFAAASLLAEVRLSRRRDPRIARAVARY